MSLSTPLLREPPLSPVLPLSPVPSLSPDSSNPSSPSTSPSIGTKILNLISRALLGTRDPLSQSPFAHDHDVIPLPPRVDDTPAEPLTGELTTPAPTPSILTRIGTIAKEVVLPTKATIKGYAFAAAATLSGASAVSAAVSALFVENPIAKYVLLAGCSAAAGFFARRSIAYFPNFQEWFLWAFHSILHPSFMLVGAPAWMRTREVFTGLLITSAVFSAFIAHDVASRALDKLLRGMTQEDLEQAYGITGADNSADIHASKLAAFFHHHWKSLAFTAAMLAPTVVLSIPSVVAEVQTGSPFLDNLITSALAGLVNAAVTIPFGYHLTKKVHYEHILRNIVQTGEKAWRNTALKVGNFILTKGNLLVTIGLAIAMNAGTLTPNIAAGTALGTLALFLAGIGLGGNHAIFEMHYDLKKQEKFKDLELGDALANPEIKNELVKNAIEKWDNLFGAAKWLRQNIGTVIGSPAVVLASLSDRFSSIPYQALYKLRAGFSTFLAGAVLQGYVSNSFTQKPNTDKDNFLEKIKAFIEYVIETKQTEFLVLFTLLANSELTYLPDGTEEVITAMVIAAISILGIANGTGQSFQNREQDGKTTMRSIQSSAAYPGATIWLGSLLVSMP